jgi:putative intracellular protease/amidase
MTETVPIEIHAGRGHRVAVDTVASTPKRVLMVVANPTTSSNNGWPVGFWAAELTHPYYELTERGVAITIASPDGGEVEFDALSDPRDDSRWSSDDLISMGFIHTPELMALLADTPRLADLDPADYDALLICGGQSPMFTFPDNADLQAAVRAFYEAEKVTGAFCHGVSALLNVTLSDGSLLVAGRTVTGFSNVEEEYGNAAGRGGDHALAAGGRPARARRQLHPGRAVQAVRRPRRAAGHRPAAVLGPRRGPQGDRDVGRLR